MDFDSKKEIPPVYLETEDTEKFLEVLQEGFRLIHDDIQGFIDIVNYEKAEEKYLDLMLIESGWSVKMEMTVNLKRRLIKIAQYLYSQKGLASGVIYAVLVLMNKTIQIYDGIESGFSLGNSHLGVDTYLGYAGFFLHFEVHSPVITADEETLMGKIVDFMRWAPTTYTIEQVL